MEKTRWRWSEKIERWFSGGSEEVRLIIGRVEKEVQYSWWWHA